MLLALYKSNRSWLTHAGEKEENADEFQRQYAEATKFLQESQGLTGTAHREERVKGKLQVWTEAITAYALKNRPLQHNVNRLEARYGKSVASYFDFSRWIIQVGVHACRCCTFYNYMVGVRSC